MKFDPQQIYWQAHRGGGRAEAPDNTLRAMRYGWSLGGIPEADIRVTLDDEVVCLHDNTLRRTTDAPESLCDLPVRRLTLPQLKRCDAGRYFAPQFAGERIPALHEVFELMRADRSRLLYADIKNYDAAVFPVLMERFAALLEEYRTAGQVIVAGCDYALNRRFKREIPELHTMQWIGYWGDADPAEEKMKQFNELARRNFDGLDLVQIHLQYCPEAAGNRVWDIPPEMLKQALERLGHRLEVFLLGGFSERSVNDLLQLGVKRFATDEPRRFSEILKHSRITTTENLR